jgi:hypothetical protein
MVTSSYSKTEVRDMSLLTRERISSSGSRIISRFTDIPYEKQRNVSGKDP